MIKQAFLLTSILVSLHAVAEVDFSRYNDPDLKAMFEKVLKLEHSAHPSQLKQLSDLWEKKCSEIYYAPCFLSEKDYLGKEKGRPGHILLFRGENARFANPAVSPIVRKVLEGSQYCSSACKPNELLDVIQTQITNSEKTIIEKLTTSHMSYPGPELTDLKGDKSSSDPFVSLSSNPSTADTFFHLRAGESGRFFVISIQENNMTKIPSNCTGKLPGAGSIANYNHCNTDPIHAEYELDAVLSVKSEDILDVLVVK